MLDKATEFIRSIAAKEDPRSFSLFGKSGTGKTHLAMNMYRFIYANLRAYQRPLSDIDPEYTITDLHNVRFASWPDVCRQLRNGTGDRLFNDLCRHWFVVIDDIGAEYESDAMMANLTELADQRLGKWTIYTSNKTVDYYDEKDERFASRLFRHNGIVLEITSVEDYNRRS